MVAIQRRRDGIPLNPGPFRGVCKGMKSHGHGVPADRNAKGGFKVIGSAETTLGNIMGSKN